MGKPRFLGEIMEFRILGPLTIFDGARKLEVGTPRTRALLAILLITPNQIVSIDRLIDELWPDSRGGRAGRADRAGPSRVSEQGRFQRG